MFLIDSSGLKIPASGRPPVLKRTMRTEESDGIVTEYEVVRFESEFRDNEGRRWLDSGRPGTPVMIDVFYQYLDEGKIKDEAFLDMMKAIIRMISATKIFGREWDTKLKRMHYDVHLYLERAVHLPEHFANRNHDFQRLRQDLDPLIEDHRKTLLLMHDWMLEVINPVITMWGQERYKEKIFCPGTETSEQISDPNRADGMVLEPLLPLLQKARDSINQLHQALLHAKRTTGSEAKLEAILHQILALNECHRSISDQVIYLCESFARMKGPLPQRSHLDVGPHDASFNLFREIKRRIISEIESVRHKMQEFMVVPKLADLRTGAPEFLTFSSIRINYEPAIERIQSGQMVDDQVFNHFMSYIESLVVMSALKSTQA